MTTPDEAKRAAVENFQAQHDVACRTGTATSVIPSTRVAFYAGFDAGHASRDAEVEALREALEAAARSLEALSRCGTASNMTWLDVRDYASSRARIARAAIANRPEGE